MKTLADWLQRLEQLNPNRIELGLDRLLALPLGQQLKQFAAKVITVTGTNGKGSCVALLEAAYLAAGYRVGSYTSPHLLEFNERIRLQGKAVASELLVEAFDIVAATNHDNTLTYFEFITLAALSVFQQANLDVLILEVGLGGRLDAVNIVDCDLAIISSIGLDHTALLGDSRHCVAQEKFGISRSHRPLVCGDPCPPANLARLAATQQVPYWQAAKHFGSLIYQGHWDFWSQHSRYTALPLPPLGCQNAATVLQAITLLQGVLPVSQTAIIHALATQLRGRCQTVSGGAITTLVDVAHNPAAASYLANHLRSLPCQGRTLAVTGMLGDKDIAGTLGALASLVDHWFISAIQHPRAASLTQLTQALQQSSPTASYQTAETLTLAYQNALRYAQPHDRLLIFGSFYAVQELWPLLC